MPTSPDTPSILRTLRTIPGIGKTIAQDLFNLGIHSVEDLAGRDPQALYEDHCRYVGQTVDRCMLYTFRCAVYYAEGGRDPEKLKWWNWKDV